MVILLLDELPVTTLLTDTGELDRRRFPNMARLAQRAHWFEDVAAVDPSTPRAVAAVLSGAPLPEGRLPIARDLPANLFTLLAATHRISALEPVTRLCPASLNTLLNDSRLLRGGSWLLDVGTLALHLWTPRPLADRWLPPIDAAWGDFATDAGRPPRPRGRKGFWSRIFGARAAPAPRDRAARFRHFLGRIEPGPGADLYFAHLMLPHRPWIYLPDGHLYFADSYREMRNFMKERWPVEPSLAAQAQQRHLLQAEFTDRLVGDLLDRIDELGLYERALIAITADHGISFRPGEAIRTVTPTNGEDLLRVPLLIKLPHQRTAVRHTEPHSVLDLLPTVLDVLEIPQPASLVGRSLLDAAVRTPHEPRQWEGLVHRRSVFGELTSHSDLFAFGRHADRLDLAVEELVAEAHPEVVVSLRGEGGRRVVEPGDTVLPAWVFGYFESPIDVAGFGVAVAVDGRVAATGECRVAEGRVRFDALLPPSALPPGEHRIEILPIDPRGVAWRVTQR